MRAGVDHEVTQVVLILNSCIRLQDRHYAVVYETLFSPHYRVSIPTTSIVIMIAGSCLAHRQLSIRIVVIGDHKQLVKGFHVVVVGRRKICRRFGPPGLTVGIDRR